MMNIESIMNFEIEQRVRFNPDNHGFTHLRAYGKIKDREGVVVKLPCIGYINEDGYPSQKRTGQILLAKKQFKINVK